MMRRIIREPKGAGIMTPGQDLVVLGSIGKKGALTALEKKEIILKERFSEDFMGRIRSQAENKINVTPDELSSWKAAEWEFVEEGGILAALWTLSGAYQKGISFSLEKIPVAQEIIEVCELFDLNPFRLWSGECVLAVADNGNDLATAAAARGILSAVIGKVEPGVAKKMVSAGGTGYLERPQPDEINKLLEVTYA